MVSDLKMGCGTVLRNGCKASMAFDSKKVFGLIAKAAWDLHKAVVGLDEVQINRAGFQQP